MDVILLERIGRLGQIGDTVRVRDGYARNYLLPTGRALRANDANRARFEAQKAQIIQRNEERKADARTVADRLEGKTFVAVRSAGETGQLYGSVSARDVADLMAAEGFKVGRNEVAMQQPIKMIGVHPVLIALHPEVEVTINVNVARSPDEAQRQEAGEDLTSYEAIYGSDEEDEILEDEAEVEDEAAETEGEAEDETTPAA
ncbi:LSU ribosomal protein L9P [Fulvimarina manganoxydans]|uniref:Large ribosomal subunit protein bL9 n=1 Tax=Fulvimarina manganoxydans TaxID=937218 RepID=A0A1W1ZQV4_9HYPH|nr:50S ribosomal protein L9 [Fulvimarina manganoxydans]MCK5930731.1 50S ribosomal protein L9 [Fulvimarina manganoxydans]SMC50809.1 LSU ribosomal protein L9P [Fulvimarina manganoxydans]